ncbi:endoplasmic reticulum lectin 1-like, partial [Tropilaelaps mercedesae]
MMNTDNERYKAEFAERLKSPTLTPVPTVKLDGVDHPYFAVNMSYGTLCDINQRPRTTQVWYVCDQMSDHDVHSFEEPASCTYRVVVRTPYLCKHPDYRVEVAPENEISCHPEVALTNEQPAAFEKASEAGDASERLTNVSVEGEESCSPLGEGSIGVSGQNSATGNDAVHGSCRAKSTPSKDGLNQGGGARESNEPHRLREMVRENEEFRESALQESEGGSLEDDVK